MRLELKGFQDVAVAELVSHLRSAKREAAEYPQAVLLSAPTGAGKTVIAAAVIEALIDGDESNGGAPATTVLWLTDQPELNEQTRRKIRHASSTFDDSRLVTIEVSFHERMLSPGRVYFLNTQKLGRNSSLVTPKDERPWTIWDVLRDTVSERPTDFILIIDEAHRGMIENASDSELARTIVQRFVKGGDDIPAIPIIFGISATPQRFLSVVAGKRTVRPQVDVPPEDVRASGLIKQTLLIHHPSKRTPSDYTLLGAAAQSLFEYKQSWDEYCTRSESSVAVQPALVVQVENAPSNGGKGVTTATDLALALSVIESVLGSLDENSIAHSFQEDVMVPVGDGRMIRHVAPPDIADDRDLRVIFFKTALTTGWDCPRAEVMMSFRKAVDHTSIAQLVGRMVRTPLARTIEDDEFLNTTTLYLPHYDKNGLDSVLNRLQADDPDYLPPVDIKSGNLRCRLSKDPSKAECFDVLAELPTYDVIRVRATSSLRRAVKLARLLDQDGITTDGLESLRKQVVEMMISARQSFESSEWWSGLVKDSGSLDTRTVEWALGVGIISENEGRVPINQQNVDDLFAAAGRRIGEGLHKDYWRARAEKDPSPRNVRRIAKLEVFALVQSEELEKELEAFSDLTIERLQNRYGRKIEALPPDRKEGYRQVRLTARDPESHPLGVFEHIEGQSDGKLWKDHLYIDDEGEYHYSFRSSWEEIVLKSAQQSEGFIGWLRLEPRKDWTISIPYEMGPDTKPLYPDLLVFREIEGETVVELLDPHDPGRDDWLPKVKGLARYAAKHGGSYSKIESSFVERGDTFRLDLCVERNRNAVLSAEGPNALRALFEI